MLQYDGILINRLCEELKDKIISSSIQRIRQVSHKAFILDLSSVKNFHKTTAALYISLESNDNLICLSPDKNLCTESKVKSFGSFLRKHLQSSRIIDIKNTNFERIISINIEKINDIGDLEEKNLIVELIPGRSNIILCNKDMTILDCLVHQEKKSSMDRELMPARKYLSPPSVSKLLPSAIAIMPELLFPDSTNNNQVDTHYKDQDIYTIIQNKVAGLSKYSLRTMLSSTNIDCSSKFSDLDCTQLASLKLKLKSSFETLLNQKSAIFLIFGNTLSSIQKNAILELIHMQQETKFEDLNELIKKKSIYADESLLPAHITLLNNIEIDTAIEFKSLLDATYIYLLLRLNIQSVKNLRSTASKLIKKELKKVSKRYLVHHSELQSCQDAEKDQRYGQLLYANLNNLSNTNKANSVSVIDYYSENLDQVNINLDPKISIQANASKYLKLYSKKIRRKEIMMEMLKDEKDLLDYAEESLIYIDNAADSQEIENIVDSFFELLDKLNNKNRLRNHNNADTLDNIGNENASKNSGNSYEKMKQGKMQINLSGKAGNKRKRLRQAILEQKNKQKNQKNKSKSKIQALPVRKFKSKNGLTLLIGRNAKQNEQLSLHIANKNHSWFHLKNAPGTHLILEKDFDNLNHTEIELAASLCAYFSTPLEMRNHMSKLEVDYCKVSNLKKLKSSKPGNLIYDKFKSISVLPKSPSELDIDEYNIN